MHETIAVIFDFDDTLAPDSTSGYLKRFGVDVPRFWREAVQPLLDEDWDPVPAYLFKMLELSQSGAIPPITRESLAEWGRELEFHPGVESLFERLRKQVRETNPRVSLEFYMISSGIGDILRHTSIAREFQDIWASDFHFDGNGHAVYTKKIVSFTDKTRYIFHVQKGLVGPAARGKPFDVNRKVSEQQLRVPLQNMIVVGDGYTDVPCFSLVKKQGGVAIGVYDEANRDRWGRAWGFIQEERVSSLMPADYGERSALSSLLLLAVVNMARKIELAGKTNSW